MIKNKFINTLHRHTGAHTASIEGGPEHGKIIKNWTDLKK